jgi:DNA polymerase II small subunit/DNA polymerase delta subunit B
VPHNFRIEENTAKYEELAAKIKEFYFGTEPFSKDTWPKFADVSLKIASNVKIYYSLRMFTLLTDICS